MRKRYPRFALELLELKAAPSTFLAAVQPAAQVTVAVALDDDPEDPDYPPPCPEPPPPNPPQCPPPIPPYYPPSGPVGPA